MSLVRKPKLQSLTVRAPNTCHSPNAFWNLRREAHLRAHHIQGLDLTAVWRRNRLQWANAHLRWPLGRWRSVLFMIDSWFQLYRTDGRHRLWASGLLMLTLWTVCPMVGLWCRQAGINYGQQTQLHTHQTCHPLSMFGMLWINMYESMFQFLPISSNFKHPLKRRGSTFHRPQSTGWSTRCEGDVSCCMRQMVITPDIDWFTPLRFFKVSVTISQSFEIHRLGPNGFIPIDWFPYIL